MKKGNALFLVFLLVLSCLSPIQLMASTTNNTELPKVGELVSGFKLIETGEMKLVKGKTFLFEHEKSGAKLFYIQNADKNRAFDISFRTPALDNTGVNHILEHITCSGSTQYPLKDVVFAIANQTYNTQVNAMTTHTMTTYPVASMSEVQLLKLADVYMDCAFNPAIYNEPNLLKREGWRYEKTDKKTPLNLTGIVYSEMQGYEADMSYEASFNTLKSLFPNGTISNESGGNTNDIPKLTYEQVIATHKAYYNPSNALIVLYGDLDYSKFLKLFNDTYLSKYSKKDVKVDYKEEVPFKTTKVNAYEFPVSKGTDCTDAATINYAYAMTGTSLSEDIGMDLLASYLNQSASKLQQKFNSLQMGDDLSVSYDSSLPQPVLIFSVTNGDEKKTQQLKTLVDDAMKDLIKEHFDNKILEALISNIEFDNSLATESTDLGFNIAIGVAQMWSVRDDFNYYNDFFENLTYVKEHSEQGYLENLVQRYIINNTHSALTTTIPKAGLLEQKETKRKASLSAYEKGLSSSEKTKLMEDTASFNKWNTKEDSPELIKTIQAVDVKDIELEQSNYEIKDEKINGVRFISVDSQTGETIYPALMFDTSAVPADKLHYLELYTNLLGTISTKQYNVKDLSTEDTRYLNGFSATTLTWSNLKVDHSLHPVLAVEWLGKAHETNHEVSLVKEILLNTNINNKDEILSYVKKAQSSYKTYFNTSPLNVARSYMGAGVYTDTNYDVYMHDLAYYHFLKKVEKELETNPKQVIKELNEVRQTVLNQTNLIVLFAGSETSKAIFMEQVKNVINALPAKKIVSEDYSCLPSIGPNIGIEMDTTMNYNILSVSFSELSREYNGKYIPLMQVISENYLTPKLRYQNNVYTNEESVSENGITFITYMDPYVKETLNVYDKIPEFIQKYNLTDESLKGYIINALSNYTVPAGELGGAVSDLYYYLSGYSKEDIQKTISEIKSATVADFKGMSGLFSEISSKGSLTTVAAPNTLKKNRDLYDNIISLDGENKALFTLQYVTKGEFIEYVFGEGLYEKAVSANIIKGKKDEVITMEEAIVALYRMFEIEGFNQTLPEGNIKISNAESLSAKGYEAIKRFAAAKLITLEENSTFKGDEKLTYAKFIELMKNVAEFLNDIEDTLKAA